MSNAKPTHGRCEVIVLNNRSGAPRYVVDAHHRDVCNLYAKADDGSIMPFDDAEPNATLIAEAFNVHNETGLTPRQLQQQRDIFLDALIGIVEAELPSRTDRGLREVAANRFRDIAKAAIAAAKGGAS